MADYRLTKEGLTYLRNGLPEKNLVEAASKSPMTFEEAKEKIENFTIALQWAKKKGLVEIRNGKITAVKSSKFEEQSALEKINSGSDVGSEIVDVLVQRNLVEKVSHEVENLQKEVEGKIITQLTPEMLKTGVWKKARGFAPYDKSAQPARKMFQGKIHPYRQIINELREKLTGMGFVESRGPYVESEFWNFDALFVPQDHPARSGLHDTFVVKGNNQSKIVDKGTWERVKATHEFGWITGSKGWGDWNLSSARRLILRAQNTAVSARAMSNLKKEDIPHKMFCIDRVFRRDVIDAKHLIDFDQCEGIIVGDGINFRHLMGYIREISKVIGAKEVRFKPSYFPFTEPSLEIYAQIEGFGWVEIGGAGMMRPEVTSPLGVEVPVIAFGIGIGRLAMIRLGISDIRQLYSDNIGWLREKSVPR